MAALDPGGIDVLTSTVDEFGAALTRENHTLKRALTDPRLLSGIGNAYSDEILHAARLSPMLLTSRLDREAIARLHAAAIDVLTRWRDALIAETGDAFPEKVTAFREGMAAHGRFGKPCLVVRDADSAHPLRGQRGELLPDVPDRRQTARRSEPVASPAGGLAAVARRDGAAHARTTPGVVLRKT